MKPRVLLALAVASAMASAACSHRAESSAATASAATAAPVYPGSRAEAHATISFAAWNTTAGKAFSTSDSFATVYNFYKKNLPAGSEQSFVTSPKRAAVFLFGPTGDRLSVTIASAPVCCKTLILIARAKA